MKKVIAILTILLTLPLQSHAGGPETEEMINLIKKTGTTVSINTNKFDPECNDRAGYYTFEKGKEDLFVICEDQVDMDDSAEVWEVVAHESAHIMQACSGRKTYFDVKYLPRIFRELQSKTPHYANLIDNTYHGRDASSEAEAFWMEIQPPSDVINYFKEACFE